MSSVSRPDPEARQRWAAEIILNSESLTDDLGDLEASRLLTWATASARLLALATTIPPPVEAQTALKDRLSALRQLVLGINRLAGESRPAYPASPRSRRSGLAATAQALDLASPDEQAIAAYVWVRDELEAGARLEWLLRLLGEERAPTEEPPTAQ